MIDVKKEKYKAKNGGVRRIPLFVGEKDGKTFYDIPYAMVKEYGIADVLATEEVAVKQLEAFGTTFGELFNDIDTNTQAVA